MVIDKLPGISRVRCSRTYRIISTRYPPVDIFERVAPRENWDSLIELEMLTNPRIREEIGAISNIPENRRVYGPGSSYVMAPFAYMHKSRFSDGSFGIYYASNDFSTALHEVAYHRGKFLSYTNEPPLRSTEKTLSSRIDSRMHDVRSQSWEHVHDPDSYVRSRELGRKLRYENESNGIVYRSVRYPGGMNIAAFFPDVVSIPVESRKIELQWNGNCVEKWFDYESGQWEEMEYLYIYSSGNAGLVKKRSN